MDWDATQKTAFVEMQFDAQHAYYQEQYERAAFDVILVDGQPPAGSTWRAKTTTSASSTSRCCPSLQSRHRHDAAAGLQSEATAAGKPLRIHVERFNPALRLYERLGFRQLEDKGVYLFMEWQASRPSA